YNAGAIAFRDIRLRPLGYRSLLKDTDGAQGEDAATPLAHWKQYPDMDGNFAMNDDDQLHITGGRGQLESKESFGDFTLFATTKTSSPNLNGGIFFRCMPGDQMMGYECQISHEMKDNDPMQPADCGTGGIFRRQDARVIAGADQKWSRLLLRVAGDRMAAWVDGIAVSDWRDTRPENENPRKGKRLQAGTLMLQAHDPTTDILVQDLLIVKDR
ncbi:MAG: DUF1080 domain-containing protein, partial [Planctomycetota bacterium]